jgi:hypothetical protein
LKAETKTDEVGREEQPSGVLKQTRMDSDSEWSNKQNFGHTFNKSREFGVVTVAPWRLTGLRFIGNANMYVCISSN